MTLTLTPELEERLERRLRGGRWHSPAEVLETALDMLDELEDVIVLSKDELDAKLEQSFADVKRGAVYNEEEARAYMANMRASL
jgi:Arc/MetJ-type ribon-helix-helix transcriptional regulator